MGRLEKIVVVTVLFLVAVILGVSLNSGPDVEAGASGGPLSREGAKNGGRARGEDAESDGGAGPATASNPAAGGNPNGLLNSSLTANPAATGAPSTTQPAKTPPTGTPPNAGTQPGGVGNSASNTPAVGVPANANFLATREGLEPTAAEEWMLYSWKAGDTFKELAKRYYGSELHVARLRSANEGRDEAKLAAGDKILVAARSLSTTPGSGAASGASDGNAAAGQKTSTDGKSSAWSGGLYEVKSGDVLGTISQTVYGTSRSWKKIYDANRDVLGDNPNTLKVGTKLRIPE